MMFGFAKVKMNDHDLALWVKEASYTHNGNSVSWVKDSITIAVVFYDNALLTRDIWIKESE